MAVEKVINHLKKFNMEERILTGETSSATVKEAAITFNTEEDRIAKTLSFRITTGPILIVVSGNSKIDNSKYKAEFHEKAHMLAFDEVESVIGHPVGGVCPFGVNDGVDIYLDESLKKYETVFPACGETNNAIEITLPELELVTGYKKWINVTKNFNE